VIYRQAGLARALLARVEAGEDLAWALGELVRWEKLDAALVRGSGRLASAVLERDGEAPEALEGPLELVALSGTVRFEDGAVRLALRGVVAAPGRPVLAGALRDVRAAEVDLVLDVLEDEGLDWRIDPTGRSR
jgi:predicted DNA-binding protein with PD1-like motif